MTLTRRRVLALSAAALALPARAAAPQVFATRALGAEVRVTLAGAKPQRAARAFRRVEAELARVEGWFSLHRDSALARLNRDGRLAHPAPEFHALVALAGRVHRATGGVFDPSVQPLWRALAEGGDAEVARRRVGWERVRVSRAGIALEPGMALTFNGIAQGFAADRLAAVLRAEGFSDVLVDSGEIAALGHRPDGAAWEAAIVRPDGREVARAALSGRALAVSAPFGTVIGAGLPHILHPGGRPPRRALAAVTAGSAALADALSTAFCLMDDRGIAAALAAFPRAALAALA